MGYYIKHIVTIDENSNKENLQKLQKVIQEVTDFNFKVFNDHLDDSNWNFGMGTSHFDDTFFWENVSDKIPEIQFTVHCVSEDNAIYDYNCYNGYASETIYRNSDEWYKMVQNDDYKRATGAHPKYYDDPGMGNDYHIKYGDETVPAGVQWWKGE
ncbi:MAG: hypothetical protein [Wendovervirus sonii]|uniref:YubB ferredoxin-like domain-containing protein n=1 Tax=phage Lak_Megaphage_Sonny TaxID=3109229 RepID=A0ABZ0Z3I4_9CAUD|nr:MAG: hypothetical protein [phage Lak_Megaphage_Sonny]